MSSEQETISKQSMNLTSIGTGVLASSPFEKEFFGPARQYGYESDVISSLSSAIYVFLSFMFVLTIIFSFFYSLYDAFQTGHGPVGKFLRFTLAFVHSYFYLALRVAGYL